MDAAGRFPPTRHSIVAGAQSDDPDARRQAFDVLVAAYWKPVYKYLRLKWQASDEDARDLTQEFFARAFEKAFFQRYDPDKARFRTYLRVCLDGFAANERKAARRLKRGGDHAIVPLDFQSAEGELRQHEIPDGADLDEGIVVGSVFKGLITGLLIGFFARTRKSLPVGIAIGLVIGLFFAFLVAAMPSGTGEHYYWQIMLPGGILGMIVGYATFTYRRSKTA